MRADDTSLFNSLPNELTVNIFNLMLNQCECEDANTIKALALQMYRLGFVCKQWRTTINHHFPKVLDMVERAKLLSIQHRKIIEWNQVSTFFSQAAAHFFKANSHATKIFKKEKVRYLSDVVNFIDTINELTTREFLTFTLMLHLMGDEQSDKMYLDKNYYDYYQRHFEDLTRVFPSEKYTQATVDDAHQATYNNFLEHLRYCRSDIKAQMDKISYIYHRLFFFKQSERTPPDTMPDQLVLMNRIYAILSEEKKFKEGLDAILDTLRMYKIQDIQDKTQDILVTQIARKKAAMRCNEKIFKNHEKLKAIMLEIIGESEQIKAGPNLHHITLFKRKEKLEKKIAEYENTSRECKKESESCELLVKENEQELEALRQGVTMQS